VNTARPIEAANGVEAKGLKHRAREFGGFTLIWVGVAGLVVPVIPGIPLIAAGVGVLGSDHDFVRLWRGRLVKKGVLKAEKPKASEPLDAA